MQQEEAQSKERAPDQVQNLQNAWPTQYTTATLNIWLNGKISTVHTEKDVVMAYSKVLSWHYSR
jgi:hypothetical protein